MSRRSDNWHMLESMLASLHRLSPLVVCPADVARVAATHRLNGRVPPSWVRAYAMGYAHRHACAGLPGRVLPAAREIVHGSEPMPPPATTEGVQT